MMNMLKKIMDPSKPNELHEREEHISPPVNKNDPIVQTKVTKDAVLIPPDEGKIQQKREHVAGVVADANKTRANYDDLQKHAANEQRLADEAVARADVLLGEVERLTAELREQEKFKAEQHKHQSAYEQIERKATDEQKQADINHSASEMHAQKSEIFAKEKNAEADTKSQEERRHLQNYKDLLEKAEQEKKMAEACHKQADDLRHEASHLAKVERTEAKESHGAEVEHHDNYEKLRQEAIAEKKKAEENAAKANVQPDLPKRLEQARNELAKIDSDAAKHRANYENLRKQAVEAQQQGNQLQMEATRIATTKDASADGVVIATETKTTTAEIPIQAQTGGARSEVFQQTKVQEKSFSSGTKH